MGQKESKYIEPYEQNVGQEEEMTENNTNVQREVDCWTDFPNEMGRIRIKRKVMDKKVNEHPENTDMEKKAGWHGKWGAYHAKKAMSSTSISGPKCRWQGLKPWAETALAHGLVHFLFPHKRHPNTHFSCGVAVQKL